VLPLVEELSDVPTIEHALDAFSEWPDLILFESALQRDELGRYSFLTADPFQRFSLEKSQYGSNPFDEIRDVLSRPEFRIEKIEGLPPFQGGAAGLLSYELGGCFERMPQSPCDEFQMPALQVGLYDWVLAWDHNQHRAWVICHGLGATARSERRRKSVLRRLAEPESVPSPLGGEGARRAGEGEAQTGIGAPTDTSKPPSSGLRPPSSPRGEGTDGVPKVAPQFPLDGWPGVTSDFSRDDYICVVEKVREYIYAGDIFQANLSQRLLIESDDSPIEIYKRLRKCNAAPFAGFLQHDDWAIVSASPERFIKVEDGVVTTRPIKGTRQRRTGPEADLFSRDELRQSEKDVAENVMIVDLMRNDLSRVCTPGSVSVPQLCTVESYETVQHLVSEVRGQLAVDKPLDSDDSTRSRLPDLWDLLRATFPGGSITGAPKVRAMEIIAELEPTARGPYCGSLFYAGFDGTFDSSILIRTFACRHGWVQCSAGGGIVAQSDPVREYEETLHKAEGMLRAFGHAQLPD
jgi:para-aminobenzoate synthetase component 1